MVEADDRMAVHPFARDLLQPAQHELVRAVSLRRVLHHRRNPAARDLPGLGADRALDGLLPIAALVQPAGAGEQRLRSARAFAAAAKVVADQVMEAIPLGAPVERDQEQALRFRRGEQSLRFAAAGCRSRQGRADPIELRHLMKQPANAGIQAIEHDFPQVFDDVAIGPREIVDERLRVCLALHRERGELQRRRPAFGLLGQLRAALGAECVGQPGFAEALDLACVERKLLLSQLQQPATQAQLAESQRAVPRGCPARTGRTAARS